MITAIEVVNKKKLKVFVDFPNKLYRENPYFIPAVYSDDMKMWNPRKNPAYKHCESKCFLAVDETGAVVGRIAVIINRIANEKWKNAAARFSNVDFVDNPEVSSVLFEAAEKYAREMGCTEIVGPLGFCDLDREGLLISGFNERSMFITYYNAPYYAEHFERLGYQKNFDWVEFLISIPEPDSEVSERISRLTERVAKRHGFKIDNAKNMRGLLKYLHPIFELINVAYAHLYGTVPLTEEQTVYYSKNFTSLVDPRFTCVALDSDGKLAGFGISVPSIANALKKSNGRLFPFGFIRILRAMKKNDTLDLLLVAVRPELRGTGLNMMIVNHVMKNAQKLGIKYAETGPQMDTNTQIQSQWKLFETRNHKTRRCYIKKI